MKRFGLVGLSALLLVSLASVSARASFTLTFDENGNGTLTDHTTGAVTPDPGHLALDPTDGLSNLVLIYDLPNTVGSGDVAFIEPGTGAVDDLIRFTNFDGNGHMIFYSDAGDTDLADSGLPSNANTSFQIAEGADGSIIYDIPNNNHYDGFSGADVPEPGSVALLLGMGLTGTGFLVRRRKK